MLTRSLFAFLVGTAFTAAGCSRSHDDTAGAQSADHTTGGLTVQTWKELGGPPVSPTTGAISTFDIFYPQFVAVSPTSAAAVINGKLEAALQAWAAEQGKDISEMRVSCAVDPGNAGQKLLSANVAGLLSLRCSGDRFRLHPGPPTREFIAKVFNYRILGDAVSELSFGDVFVSERALHPLLQQALERDLRLQSTSQREDLQLALNFADIPFHFETIDGSQTAATSLVNPLPAIYFHVADGFPFLTDVPTISIAIADLGPALVPNGPASLLMPPAH